jgi:hypothetical protein
VIPCGRTQIPLDVFDDYLSDLKQRYTAGNYHLLEFNCNSFTQDVVGFLTGTEIPAWISSESPDQRQGSFIRGSEARLIRVFSPELLGYRPPCRLFVDPVRTTDETPDRRHVHRKIGRGGRRWQSLWTRRCREPGKRDGNGARRVVGRDRWKGRGTVTTFVGVYFSIGPDTVDGFVLDDHHQPDLVRRLSRLSSELDRPFPLLVVVVSVSGTLGGGEKV